MGIGNKDLLNKIFFLRSHAHFALTAPSLAFIKAYRVPFDIPRMGYGDDHVFFDNHIFNIDIFRTQNDFRSPFVTVPAFISSSSAMISASTFCGSSRIPCKSLIWIDISRYSLSIFSRSRPVNTLQPHLQNGFCLDFGKSECRTED